MNRSRLEAARAKAHEAVDEMFDALEADDLDGQERPSSPRPAKPRPKRRGRALPPLPTRDVDEVSRARAKRILRNQGIRT